MRDAFQSINTLNRDQDQWTAAWITLVVRCLCRRASRLSRFFQDQCKPPAYLQARFTWASDGAILAGRPPCLPACPRAIGVVAIDGPGTDEASITVLKRQIE